MTGCKDVFQNNYNQLWEKYIEARQTEKFLARSYLDNKNEHTTQDDLCISNDTNFNLSQNLARFAKKNKEIYTEQEKTNKNTI